MQTMSQRVWDNVERIMLLANHDSRFRLEAESRLAEYFDVCENYINKETITGPEIEKTIARH